MSGESFVTILPCRTDIGRADRTSRTQGVFFIGGAMRSATLFLALLMLTFVLAPMPRMAAGAPQGSPELLTHVRAADLLADLITYTNSRADARVENIRQY